MKLTFTIIAALFLTSLFAQTPQKMSYQAIIRNSSGQLVSSHVVGMKISVLQGSASGTVVATETQTPTTDVNGLISIEIGGSPGFNAINWATGSYFIKTETDPSGGTNYTIVGTSQLLSVPYALHAKTVEIDNVNDADADPVNEIQTLSLSGTNLTLSKSGGTVTLPSSGVGDNWGTQVVKTNSSLTGQGNDSSPLGVVSSALTPTWTNIQNVPAGFADGVDNVDDADHDITNEIQVLSLTGSNLSLSNGGGTVVIPSSGGGSGWSLTGNAGTAATNFIGTTDGREIIFKQNNIRAGLLSLQNTSFGVYALNPLSAGMENTAIGLNSLSANTGGSFNTALGFKSLYSNTTGSGNTAIGSEALKLNTEGDNNTTNGYLSLRVNRTGNDNTATGYFSLGSNVSGGNNTAIGSAALLLNTTGDYNTAIGSDALLSNTTGNENTANGYKALYTNSTGNNNTASGNFSLFSNTTGRENTAIGRSSLYYNSTGNSNTAIGSSTLTYNITGVGNSANGFGALGQNRTGNYNIANGYSTLYYNISGSYNTASGFHSLFNNATGGYNTATGSEALLKNTSGNYNIADGEGAMYSNTIGSYNTACGIQSLYLNTVSFYNTATGSGALYNATGASNTASGVDALRNVTTGANNAGFGWNAQVPSATGSNQVRIGNASISYAGVQVAWTIGSDRRWKTDIKSSDLGLNFITRLKPVSYVRITDETKKAEYGFIAQEVDETLKSVGATQNGMITIDDAGMYNLRYNDIIAPLVKSTQELNSKISALEKMNAELIERILKLEDRLK